MSSPFGAPERAGSIGRSARGSTWIGMLSLLVVALVIVGGLGILSSAPRPTAPAGSSRLTAALPASHSDLVITSGHTYAIAPPSGSAGYTYYQGGNITVEPGGTLIVTNATLSFVQYVGSIGSPEQRLSHIFHFLDQGTVDFTNATLTTDVQALGSPLLNSYAKLNVTVEGDMTARNSTFAFPGWIDVVGTAADLTLNGSVVTRNPDVAALPESGIILGDTDYAATILVTGGAQFNVFNSTLEDTYKNPDLLAARIGPAPLQLNQSVLGTGINNYTSLYTPANAANLSQDWLYPNADFEAGSLWVRWSNVNTAPVTADISIWYDGTQYAIGTLVLASSGSGYTTYALPPALLQTITTDGVLNYLNWTGDFGLASRIAFEFDVVSGPAGANASAGMTLLPSLPYNMIVSGADTTLNSVDGRFDLNWNQPGVNSTSIFPPLPWLSNKLLVTDSAKAYLANWTVTNPIPGVYNYSAVLPDSTSSAVLYRWAQFNLTGKGGVLAVPGAHLAAYYAYSAASDSSNATANALNALSVANPQIWSYVQYWDQMHGVRAYGESNLFGVVRVLLASSWIPPYASNPANSSLPDGFFVGDYHIGILAPVASVPNHWLNWSVSPYPEGVAQSSPAVATPDFGPAQNFPQYFAGVSITVDMFSGGAPSTSVNLGQKLGVEMILQDTGSAPVDQLNGSVYYNRTFLLGWLNTTDVDLTTPGQVYDLWVNWTATANVTGPYTSAFSRTLMLVLVWNYNETRFGGGDFTGSATETFLPTEVTIATTLLANGIANNTVELGQTLGVKVTVNEVANSTVADLSAKLLYNATAVLGWYNNTAFGLSPSNRVVTFTFLWKATENVTGLHGWFTHNLSVALDWNAAPSTKWLGSGSLSQNVTVNFAPSLIRFVTVSAPPATLDLSQLYISTGALAYNGSHPATIEIFATPVGGGTQVEIAAGTTLPGNFSIPWFDLSQLVPGLTAGTTYTLTATATYNSRVTTYTIGTTTVPPTPSSTTNFFLQKFLGLPLWAWLAIAAAAAIAIVLFLFVVRRRAAGKLVECGECGNLIPEDATVCPKCGAEFESDLIRCSRCASTIPADSKFCPECAAQLLGTPGEGASDPEKQAYADFTEKYRAEAKRELGDNYSEGAFWDWWKRQPSYTPFSQWSLQQGQGTARVGMTAPPAGTETKPEGEAPAAGKQPPKGGPGWAEGPPAAAAAPAAQAAGAVPPAAAGLKACPNCGKEIPAEYLVCPFCNAVTQ